MKFDFEKSWKTDFSVQILKSKTFELHWKLYIKYCFNAFLERVYTLIYIFNFFAFFVFPRTAITIVSIFFHFAIKSNWNFPLILCAKAYD